MGRFELRDCGFEALDKGHVVILRGFNREPHFSKTARSGAPGDCGFETLGKGHVVILKGVQSGTSPLLEKREKWGTRLWSEWMGASRVFPAQISVLV